MAIPKTMQAAVLFGHGDLRVTEANVPEPGAQEVLIRVEACAICGTDPKIIAHGWPGNPPFGQYIPGHEFAGAVAALGEGVTNYALGDRIAVEPHKGCGICENCVRGFYTTCLNYGDIKAGHRHYGFTVNGGYAQYAVSHVNTLHRIPSSLSFDEATLITTAGTALYGITRIGGVRPGETVVVSGPGPIGLMACQLARTLGAGTVILTGTRPERLKLGEALGAKITLNVRECETAKEIFKLTGGVGADLTIECAGTAQAARDAVEFTRKNGRVALVGIYEGDVPVNLNKVVQWNMTLAGGKAEGDWSLRRVLPLMADGRIKAKPLITHRFPLSEINEAMSTFVERTGGAIKVIVHPQKARRPKEA
jgi:2-desacetyl-2-hydroxyethyl bacteriochlorophyllide A dehydrogenase